VVGASRWEAGGGAGEVEEGRCRGSPAGREKGPRAPPGGGGAAQGTGDEAGSQVAQRGRGEERGEGAAGGGGRCKTLERMQDLKALLLGGEGALGDLRERLPECAGPVDGSRWHRPWLAASRG
jgi:hypothetical protein